MIEILRNIATINRDYRCALRIVLQDCKKWFDDEVDPEVRERTSADGHGELTPIKVITLYFYYNSRILHYFIIYLIII